MEVKLRSLKEINPNDKNPRIIKNDKFLKLVDSVLWFPKMLWLRPIVLNSDDVALGGNQRYKALCYIAKLTKDKIEARLRQRTDKSEEEVVEMIAYWCKWQESPVAPTLSADELTEEEKKEFIAKDNISHGEWDWEMLNNEWDRLQLETYGLDLPSVKDKFEKEFEKWNDDNCVYPLVPKFDEKHEIFILVCDSEVDANFLRDKLGMQKMKSYKKGKLSKSNIISVKDVIKCLQNSNTES